MKFNGAVGNAEREGNQFVAFALQEKLYDFPFTIAQWGDLRHIVFTF